VLAYGVADQGPVAFRIADEITERPDAATSLRNTKLRGLGWVCHFDRSILPPGELRLSAWAFDAQRGLLYQLGNAQEPILAGSEGTPSKGAADGEEVISSHR
jgi:hypothetical protein